MAKLVFGVAGLSGSGKAVLMEYFSGRFGDDLKIVRLEDLVDELFQFGEEGHRQIVNYFGEEFLKKNGELNVKKLWKFVYSDQHKLRILDFLLEPLMLNRMQEKVDGFDGVLIVEGLNFKIEGWQKVLTKKIWVGNSEENILNNLRKRRDLPVSAEKYFDVQTRLYLAKKPEGYCLFNNSQAGQLEKRWLELCKTLDI